VKIELENNLSNVDTMYKSNQADLMSKIKTIAQRENRVKELIEEVNDKRAENDKLTQLLKDKSNGFNELEAKEMSQRIQWQAMKEDRDREWAAREETEQKLKELQKELTQITCSEQEKGKKLISIEEQVKYYESRAIKYETLYEDVNTKVEFA